MQDPQSLHKYAYVHGDPIGLDDPAGMFAGLAGTMISAGLRMGLTSTAIGAVLRMPTFISDIYQGKDFDEAMWNYAKGLAFDFAIGAVLGGGATGVLRFASNSVKLRALGQSVSSFRFARLPWSAWQHTGSVAANKARGLLIERTILSRAAGFLGREIKGFPVIDDYIIRGGRGIATSIKSLDLTAGSYQSASRLLYQLNEKMAVPLQNLTTRTWGGFTVGNAANPIDDKILVIAFEQGAATATQARAIQQFLSEAAARFPDVKIVIQFVI